MPPVTIDEVLALFSRYGSQRYGEDVTQLEHALQAADAARADSAGDALLAAALLHDVGQFLDDSGNAAEAEGIDARHEVNGSQLLSGTFPLAVTEPIRLHVDAKRYLCFAEPGYADRLSRASMISLNYQGGPMTADEAAQFEAEPFFADAVRLRHYDDLGKRPDSDASTLDSYRPLLEALRESHLQDAGAR